MGSRRDFIRLVLLGSGAVYAVNLGGCKRPSELRLVGSPRKTYSTPKFKIAHAYMRDGAALPAPSKNVNCDVVIVGSGISALVAAIRLEQEGKHVILIESEPRPGGTAVSVSIGGGNAPLGSVYFVDQTEDIDLLLKRAKIEPEKCPEDGYDFGKGEVVRDLWTDETLNRVVREGDERDGMKRFRDLMLGLEDDLPLYPLPEVMSPNLTALDVSAEDWVRSFKSQTLLTVMNAYSRSSMGALLSRTNVYCLQNFYVSEFGPTLGSGRYTIPGGTGQLTSRVAKSLHDVRTNLLVMKIENVGSGVAVEAINDKGEVIRFTAGHAIMGAQKYQAPYIIPDLPTAQVQACKGLSYAPYMTLHVVSDVPMMQEDIYDTWNLTSDFETDVVNPRSVPNVAFEKHVSSLYLPMDQFARGQLQDPELFARRATDVVDRFISSRSVDQQSSVREIYCWGWGHSMVIPTPGSHSGVAQAARRRHGNIIFANTDCDAAPAIENASNQGSRAAREVMEPHS